MKTALPDTLKDQNTNLVSEGILDQIFVSCRANDSQNLKKEISLRNFSPPQIFANVFDKKIPRKNLIKKNSPHMNCVRRIFFLHHHVSTNKNLKSYQRVIVFAVTLQRLDEVRLSSSP